MSSLSSKNSTFTKKLRAAIKAKIEEMGIDADDELPDYVMVLAANKKEKSQMKSDLQLFLGKHTSSFVEWLFDAFDRIKAGGNETADRKPQDEALKKEDESIRSFAKPKESEKESSTRKSRDRHSSKRKTDKPKEPPSTADLQRPTGVSRCGPLQNAVVSILKTNPPVKSRESKDDQHRSRSERTDERKRRRRIEIEEVQRDERRKKLRYEEKEEGAEEVGRDGRHKRRSTKIQIEKEEAQVVVIKEERRGARSKKEPRSESPLQVGASPPRLRVERKKEHSPPRSPIRSPVRKAVRDFDRESTQESTRKEPKFDYKRRESPGGRVEEKKEEKTIEKTPEQPQTPPNCTTFIIRVGDREIRRVVPNDPPTPTDGTKKAAEESRRKRRADDPGRTALRLLGCQLQRPPAPESKAEVARPPSPTKRPRITMEAEQPRVVAAPPKKPPIERYSPQPLTAAWNGRITIEDETSDEDEQQIDKVIAALDREQLSGQILPTAMLTRPAFFVPPSAAVQQMVVPTAVQFPPMALPTATVSNERCRFWPNCDRGAACGFAHPTKPCSAFPYCAFGDKCLFIHPICKFNTRCTRARCPFTHDLKGTIAPLLLAAASTPPVAADKSTIPCRFQGKCADARCEYKHPPACRFGLACRNAHCSFAHRRPDLKKFQWTSTAAVQPAE